MTTHATAVEQHFELALQSARAAILRGDYGRAWPELERAHILGQRSVVAHLRSHWAMLICAWRQNDLRETWGQLGRLLAAAPASALGIYPIGNTGRSTVSAFKPMPIPTDLQKLLSDKTPPSNSGHQA